MENLLAKYIDAVSELIDYINDHMMNNIDEARAMLDIIGKIWKKDE